MDFLIRQYTKAELTAMTAIWNEVVMAGNAFPQTECLDAATAADFFEAQSYTGIAVATGTGQVLGLYILHPNNVGRCGHIANASYAVSGACRGKHIGRALVADSMDQAKKHGFRILQFNAVVATNFGALHLYDSLGFIPMTPIPGGFRMNDGSYADIIPHYRLL